MWSFKDRLFQRGNISFWMSKKWLMNDPHQPRSTLHINNRQQQRSKLWNCCVVFLSIGTLLILGNICSEWSLHEMENRLSLVELCHKKFFACLLRFYIPQGSILGPRFLIFPTTVRTCAIIRNSNCPYFAGCWEVCTMLTRRSKTAKSTIWYWLWKRAFWNAFENDYSKNHAYIIHL